MRSLREEARTEKRALCPFASHIHYLKLDPVRVKRSGDSIIYFLVLSLAGIESAATEESALPFGILKVALNAIRITSTAGGSSCCFCRGRRKVESPRQEEEPPCTRGVSFALGEEEKLSPPTFLSRPLLLVT